MSSILKISEAASLALHGVVLLASEPERSISTKEVASRLNVSEAHLSKVFQRLARVGLVESTRGPKGGFRLLRAAEEITLLDVYESIEGPFALGKCPFEVCTGEKCMLGELLGSLEQRIKDYLTETKLNELTSCVKEQGKFQ